MMHWVDRGSEPTGLPRIRRQYTNRWIRHYPNRIGTRPSDSYWRDFIDDLRRVFGGLCAYCETTCNGEVDHFRPKSKFPSLVYVWSNWLYACHDCNFAKLDRWPSMGYVNPCSNSSQAQPEDYFDFDVETGHIRPKMGLDRLRHEKATRMISDLGLNRHHHLRDRRLVLELLMMLEQGAPSTARRAHSLLASRNSPRSSVARAWLVHKGYPF